MTTDRELMQQALDSLEQWNTPLYKRGNVITALRARLAQPEQPDWSKAGFGKPQPESKVYSDIDEMFRDMGVPVTEQEPVAWVCHSSATNEKHIVDFDQDDIDALPVGTMLYTAPPQREWQGLTESEIESLRHLIDWTAHWSYGNFARAIEAKLREKNA